MPSWTLLIPMIEIDDAVNAWADDAKGFGLSAKAGLEALNKGGQRRRWKSIFNDAVAAMSDDENPVFWLLSAKTLPGRRHEIRDVDRLR